MSEEKKERELTVTRTELLDLCPDAATADILETMFTIIQTQRERKRKEVQARQRAEAKAIREYALSHGFKLKEV